MESLLTNLLITLSVGFVIGLIYRILAPTNFQKKNKALACRVFLAYILIAVSALIISFASMFTATSDGVEPDESSNVDAIRMEPKEVEFKTVEEPTLEESWDQQQIETEQSLNARKKNFLEF